MKLGIIGLPNVGKSTLFNALTKTDARAENYLFCTIEPNAGTVSVPDERLETLTKLYESKKIIPAFIDFVDIAGLVKGASKGEGRGNKFLSHIREVDAIVHVVRCFEDKDIVHVDGNVDPARDIETIEIELMLSDLEAMEKRIDKQKKLMRSSKEKKIKDQLKIMEDLYKHLSNGNPARTFTDEKETKSIIKNLFLLSSKPIIYATNVREDEVNIELSENQYVSKVFDIAKKEGAEVIIVSAKAEEEISQLDDDEKKVFLKELGFTKSGLDRLIAASYKLLGLFSFLTAGKPEVRAWTIKHGTKAPQAAGKIHTDFERGFIKAEIINYDDLIKYGSINNAREHGKVRIEGKEYVVQEGDVVNFRFNV